MYFIFALSINQQNKNTMKNPTTFLALLFITSILMLVSFATANIYLLVFAELFFFVSGSIVLLINYKQKNKTNAQRF
jgi:hypothetical protein